MIRILSDPETLSREAAALFAAEADRAIRDRGRFAVALSGGQTPRRTYELLAQPPVREQVAWDRVHVFWGDERCVPPDDPRSNARLARQVWLDRVPLPSGHIYPMACHSVPSGEAWDREQGAGPAEAAAREGAGRYEDLLRNFFASGPPRLDLVFLGLGTDGHTASLFPFTPVLQESRRWVAPVYPAAQDLFRVTLTPVLLNQAALVVFLVTGADKAGVLAQVLQGPSDPQRLPAQLIRPREGQLLWLLDREAAGRVMSAED
jgi:6-phosphogluconolactonase